MAFKKLSKAANIFCAPLAILICADSSKAWTRPHDGKKTTDIDASILTDHMMLEAADLGLGSVWIVILSLTWSVKNFACRTI